MPFLAENNFQEVIIRSIDEVNSAELDAVGDKGTAERGWWG